MKLLLIVAAIIMAAPVLADSFAEREAALGKITDAKASLDFQKESLGDNQKYLEVLSTFAKKHGGAQSPLICKSFSNEFNDIYPASVAGSGRILIRGSSLKVILTYTGEDSNQDTVNPDTGNQIAVAVQPGISSCSIRLRDGLACQTSLETENSGGLHLIASCITKTLKQSRDNLGLVF